MADDELLEVLNDLDSMADRLRDIRGTIERKLSSGNAVEDVEEKEPTLVDVRGSLMPLSRAGRGADVRSLLARFGATKLSDLDPAKYRDVISEASKLHAA